MPVDTLHPDYVRLERQWIRCRDAAAGLDRIREKNTEYLPKLGSHGPGDARYEAYMKRGLYLEAFARTVQGLSGAVFRKDPIIQGREDERIKAWLMRVDGKVQPLARFAQRLMDENLTISRVGIWLTMDEQARPSNLPRLVLVPGENITNWDAGGRWLVIKEKAITVGEDRFEHKMTDQWRLFELDEQDKLVVSLWQKKEQSQQSGATPTVEMVHKFMPMRLGERLDFIPVWIVAGDEVGPQPHKPDLLGLADASFDHYRLSTDYRHGLHFTALPTPWFAGFNQKDEILIGSGTAIVTDNPAGRAGMLEFGGQGLNPLREALSDIMEYMALLGARLLERPKRAAETAEAIRLRAVAEQTTVQSIALTLSETLTEVVQAALWWANLQDDTFSVKLNTDLIDAEINVELLKQLSAMLMAGQISQEMFYYNLERGELTPPDSTMEIELARIGQIDDDTFGAAAG